MPIDRPSISIQQSKLSNPLEAYRRIRQHFAAMLPDQHIVFDPDAAEPREVRSGFDREHHAWRHGFIRKGPRKLRNPRLLVDFEAKAVSRSVSECLGKTVIRKDLPRSRVYLTWTRTRPHSGDSGVVCLEDRGSNPTHL